jgi:ParB family chromosome partitioning protein
MAKQKKALGRGLSAILSNPNTDITHSTKSFNQGVSLGNIGLILIDTIEINPFQPRTHFNKEALTELSKSIIEFGVIQPITVRKLGYDKFQLISGERRFRACKLAGLKEIPAYIRVANDQEMLEMALVENIQRQNLDAIEIALSYQLLIDECNLTQESLAERVGKKRSTVSNYIRLLRLSPIIQAGIRDKMIGIGHARALVNIEDEKKQLKLYKQILKEEISVRDSEKFAQKFKKKSANNFNPNVKTSSTLPFSIQKIAQDFSKKIEINTEIKIQKNGKGKIIISFNNEEQLEQIIQCFKSE